MFKFLHIGDVITWVKETLAKYAPIPLDVAAMLAVNLIALFKTTPNMADSAALRAWCKKWCLALVDVVKATPTNVDDQIRDCFQSIVDSDGAWAQFYVLIAAAEGIQPADGADETELADRVADALAKDGRIVDSKQVLGAVRMCLSGK
jgi:hypothetical protein